MRQPPFALRNILSTKVRVTIYGALFLCTAVISTPAVFAQNSKVDAAEASDDLVRDALKSVFKETAPERIKDKDVPPVKKSAASSNPVQAIEKEFEQRKAKHLKDVKEIQEVEVVKVVKDLKVAKESPGKPAASKATAKHKVAFSGVADYYADRFHGKKTASGQLHDKTKMTAAHLSLPFGTKVKVVSRHTGKSCVVTVNDRGPYTKNRIIDLSFAAAKELGLVTAGSRLVDCYLIEPE
jgi:rare lipoprotein A